MPGPISNRPPVSTFPTAPVANTPSSAPSTVGATAPSGPVCTAPNAYDFELRPDPARALSAYTQSALLVGGYSGFNPVLMHWAGVRAMFDSVWQPGPCHPSRFNG